MTAVYAAAVLSGLMLAGFISYYVFRLATTSRAADDTGRRLAQLLPENSAASSTSPPASGTRSAQITPGTTLHRAGVGLRQVYPEAVFLRRDKDGSVTFQAEGRSSMPLKFLLDTRSRAALERVVAAAIPDLGPCWALLAEEDEQGRLLLTLLQ